MRSALRVGSLLVLSLVFANQTAQARVTKKGWYFPNPFTMNSPTSPHRYGGVDLGFNISDAGFGLAFPLTSTLTDRQNRFIIEMALPLSVGVPKSGSTSFYGGNPRLGMRGTWRFTFPFAGGYNLPAAWSAGADLSIPLAMAWGANTAYLLNFPTYLHDPVAWMPVFGFRPKAQIALGNPMFYGIFELSLANLITKDATYEFAVGWGLTLASQPDDMVAISLEFGGLHAVTDFLPGNQNATWGALGARLFFGQFVTGLVLRLPFTKSFSVSDGTTTFDYDPTISIGVFIGYEQRHQDKF